MCDSPLSTRNNATIADFFAICGLGPNDALEIEKFASWFYLYLVAIEETETDIV